MSTGIHSLPIRRMHDHLEGALGNHFIATSCGNDGLSCDDIIITTIETWTNQVIELCPRQKIIIEETGGLILDNTTITRNPNGPNNNPNCPDLDRDLWDGIYIMGGTGGYSLPPLGGGNPVIVPPIGFLKTMNNSVIEYSKNGIIAKQEFGLIELDDTKMKFNGKIITAIQNGAAQTNPPSGCDQIEHGKKGKVRLLNHCELLVEDNTNIEVPIHNVQIKLVHTSFKMEECTLKVVKSNVRQGTGINSMGAAVNIAKESYVENFETAIFKDIDFTIACGTGAGLTIRNSKILNSNTAIRNKSHYLYTKDNFIRGSIYSDGICYGRWYSNNIGARDNNFGSEFELTDPQTSHMIENNRFEEIDIKFIGDNSLSRATCNLWTYPDLQQGDISSVEATEMPKSWGVEASASGNQHAKNLPISMIGAGHNVIFYYEFQPDGDPFFFDYSGTFQKGTATEGHPTCSYDWPISVSGGGGSDGNGGGNSDGDFDGQTLDSMWLVLEGIILNLENDLIGADSSLTQSIQEQLDLYHANQDNVVGQVLGQITLTDSSSWVNVWMARASSKITQRRDIMNNVVADDLVNLSSLLSGMSTNNNTDAADLDNLEIAITALSQWQTGGLDIYNLPQANLDVLIGLAQLSYRDYTAVIRAFLNAHYDIIINEPQSNINLNDRRDMKENTVKYDSYTKFSIAPNPTSKCFRIRSTVEGEEIQIKVVNLGGRTIMEQLTYSGKQICPDKSMNRGVYLVKYRSIVSGEQGTLKLMIQ